MRRGLVQLASLLSAKRTTLIPVQTRAHSLTQRFSDPLATNHLQLLTSPVSKKSIRKISTDHDEADQFNIRLATVNDVKKILEISKGINEGADYLPIVIHQWLNDKRKMIFLAECEGNFIGMRIATISENRQSFVCQSMRIHPKYRGKHLSYKIANAVTDEVRNIYPQVSKEIFVADPKRFRRRIALNIGYIQIMQESIHAVRLQDTVHVSNHKLACVQLYSLSKQDAVHLYKNKKLLDLVGSHGFIMVDKGFPHQPPQDAHLLADEVDQVFVDIPVNEILQHDNIPKSFSHGKLSERVSTQIWKCHIFADDPETFKQHVVYQLNAAAAYFGKKECVIHFFQSSCSKFDGCQAVKEELSRLQISGDVSTAVVALIVRDVKIMRNEDR